MVKTTALNVLETFSSIQGEGINTGIYATFVRLAGCNLNCVWCDTKEIMSESGTWMEFDKLDMIIKNNKTHHVIFTGGEPLLQQREMFAFMKKYENNDTKYFYVETNGICKVEPEDARLAHFTISPKLVSAFDPADIADADDLFNSKYSPRQIVEQWIHTSGDIEFKFVVADERDVEALTYMLIDVPIRGMSHVPIIVQAAATREQLSIEERLAETTTLIERIKDILSYNDNIRVGIQLHKLLNVQ